MNSFNDIFDEIYNQVDQKCKIPNNNKFFLLLEYAVNLWSQKIDLGFDITLSKIFPNIQKASKEIWKEWKPKKIRNTQIELPNSNLYNIVTKFIDKSPLRGKNMNNDDIKFIVFLGLIITAVGFVVYKLNQKTTLTSDNDSYLSDFSSAPLSQKLILIVNDLKKDCLEKIKNQGNKIQSKEDCDKLYRATKCLWMGVESGLSQQFKNYSNYIAQTDQESEYDVYLVEINLPEAIEGFEKDVDTPSRLDAFRELSKLNDLSIKISPRLKVSVYENTNVYCR